MEEEGKSMAEIICENETRAKHKRTFRGIKKVDLTNYPSVSGLTEVLKIGTKKFKSGSPKWYTIVYVVEKKFYDTEDLTGVNGIPWFTPKDNPTIPKGIKEGEIWLMEVDWQNDGTFINPKITVIGYNHKGKN